MADRVDVARALTLLDADRGTLDTEDLLELIEANIDPQGKPHDTERIRKHCTFTKIAMYVKSYIQKETDPRSFFFFDNSAYQPSLCTAPPPLNSPLNSTSIDIKNRNSTKIANGTFSHSGSHLDV